MDRFELAWAAGFFDGDGWAGSVLHGRGASRRPHAWINQAGATMPEVLERFHGAVAGAGHLGGPTRISGRRDLYRWSASSWSDIALVWESLAPWLCMKKLRQFELALGPQFAVSRSSSEELAWAAGFFDAEGCVSLLRHGTHAGYFVGEAAVTQLGDVGGSEELSRFEAAVGGGKVFGPFPDRGGARLTYRWKVFPRSQIRAAVDALWPWLGSVKREQAEHVLAVVEAQPQLPRGNPAWGAYKSHCLNGHEYATARVRPFVSRRGGSERRDSKQCLTCLRERARALRIERMRRNSKV